MTGAVPILTEVCVGVMHPTVVKAKDNRIIERVFFIIMFFHKSISEIVFIISQHYIKPLLMTAGGNLIPLVAAFHATHTPLENPDDNR